MTPWLRLQLSEALSALSRSPAQVVSSSVGRAERTPPEPNLVSTGAPSGLLQDERLSVDALVLGMLLVAHAQEPDPPVLTIADLTHQLPGTGDEVRDALIELFAVGWIKRVTP